MHGPAGCRSPTWLTELPRWAQFTDKSQSPLYLNDAVATMDGFYHYENGAHHDNETDADFVMRGFAPEELPVLKKRLFREP